MARPVRPDERLVVIRQPGGGPVLYLATVTDAAPFVAAVRASYGGAWPFLEWFDARRTDHAHEVRERGLFGRPGRAIKRPVEEAGTYWSPEDAARWAAWCRREADDMAGFEYQYWLEQFAARFDALAGFDLKRGGRLWR